MHTVKSFLFRIIAIILGMAAVFIITEFGIRIISPQPTGPIQFAYDPQLGGIPVPLQRGRRILPNFYDYTYANNSHGLRGEKEYDLTKKTAFRILFLGDSFTYGLCVNDNQTFCYLVEKRLSTLSRPVEVINAGNPGSGTDYALKFFHTLGYKFKPDVVALCFFSNDFSDNARGEYYNVSEGGKISPKSLSNSRAAKKNFLRYFPFYNWLISWSHTANLFKQTAIRIIYKQKPLLDIYNNYDKNLSQEYNKKLTAIFIAHLKSLVENSKARFMVFYIPYSKEVQLYREKHEFSKEEQAIGDILRSQNEPLLSLTPILAEFKIAIEDLYYNEGHLTPLVHLLASYFISNHIEKYLK